MAEEEKKDREFKSGENVFTHMPEPELRVHAARMFDALESARSVLGQMQAIDAHHVPGNSPFWQAGGSGNNTLTKAKQAIEKLGLSEAEQESQYHSYFRYAEALLFDPGTPAVLTLWQTDPEREGGLVGTHLGPEDFKTNAQGLDAFRHHLRKDARWFTEDDFKTPENK